MSEDFQDQEPEQKRDIDINALAAAKERIESGTASPEDEAMVQGFEAGASAAHELRSLDDRVVADDLLAPTEQEISRLQAELVTDKAWGEDTSTIETKLQGHEDMKSYLDDRDYKDKNGSVHDAESGKFVSSKDANESDVQSVDDVLSETKEAADTYKDLSIDELTAKWAEAEDNNDRTTSLNVQDEIQQRLLAENRTDADGKGMNEDLKMRLIDRIHADMLSRRKTGEANNPRRIDVIDEQKDNELGNDKTTNAAQAIRDSLQKDTALHDGDLEEGQSVKVSTDETQPKDVPRAIEAAPERLAIEAAPEKLAIEAAPERKAIEAAPIEDPELSFEAGAVKQTLKHVGEEAIDRLEKEKTEMQSMGRFRRILHGLKFSTLFKRETERKRGQEVMEELGEDSPEDGVFSVKGFLDRIHGKSVANARAQEQAFLDALADDELLRAGDAVERGEGENDSPVVAEVRAKLKEHLLTYLDASVDASDGDRAELVAIYEYDVQEMIRETLEAHPGEFDEEAFMVMANSSLELSENGRLFMSHEDGRQRLEAALDSMKISIGQAQIGPNSSYNTEYLERTVEQMRRRRVGSVVGKASFVVGTWIGTGALAAGLSQQAMQSGSTSGLKYGLAAVGSTLGPVGALVGFGAGVAAASVWGRHLARQRAMDTINMMEVKSGDSGNQEVTALFEQLSQDTVSYTATTEGLLGYVEDADDGSRRLRDLQPAEVADLISGIAEVRVRLGVENSTNAAALEGNAPRAINLFEGSDAGAVQVERTEMIQALQLLEAQLEERYGESGVDIVAHQTEEGDIVYESEALDTLIAAASAERATALRERMGEIQTRREAFVRTQGRRGAVVAGSISAVFGLGGALAAEALSHGASPTIFDNLGARSNNAGNVITNPNAPLASTKLGNVEVDYRPVGASHVDIIRGGKAIEVTTPNGKVVAYDVNSHGQLSPQDVSALNKEGVSVNQALAPGSKAKAIPLNELLRKQGGKQMQVDTWLINGTEKPDGTELGVHLNMSKSGTVGIRVDPGTATGGGKSFDLLTQAKRGHLNAYLTNKGLSVAVPIEINAKGEMVAVLPKSSPLNALFTKHANGHVDFKGSMWRIGVPTGTDSYDSVASHHGLGASTVEVPTQRTVIKLGFEESARESGDSTGYTIPGLAFSGDSGPLYSDKKQEDTTPEPDTPPKPDTTPTPTEPVTVAPNVDPNNPPINPNEFGPDVAPEANTPKEIESSPDTPAPDVAPKQLEQAEVLHDAVQVQPLNPSQIIDRLSKTAIPTSLKVEISGQTLDVTGVALSGGAPRLLMRKTDGSEDFIELENLQQAIQDGKVRFNKYLGTPDADAIAKDIRVGETLYDTEIGATIRVTRRYDNGNIAYEVLDDNGDALLREPDSNPRAYTSATIRARIANGVLTPNSYRGVQIA